MSGKELSLQQTRELAAHYRETIFGQMEPFEDSEGRSARHQVWMLDRVAHDKDMTLDKASRWIGFVQGYILFYNVGILEDLKATVRAAREGVYARKKR